MTAHLIEITITDLVECLAVVGIYMTTFNACVFFEILLYFFHSGDGCLILELDLWLKSFYPVNRNLWNHLEYSDERQVTSSAVIERVPKICLSTACVDREYSTISVAVWAGYRDGH
jgi:hypothetical protein